MGGITVRLQFVGELNDFLPPGKRFVTFDHPAGTTDTLKHVIESLGVPHTEIGEVAVNGCEGELSKPLAHQDDVQVFPRRVPILLQEVPAFAVDGHLGRLAAYLRMLGFDTWYERQADDPQLAAISAREHRMLFTRDAGLLKRKQVRCGYFVRGDKPLDQLTEVTRRFALTLHFAPFTRCMDCNGPLVTVPKSAVADLLPPHTRETKNEFSRCVKCGKILWRGSHHSRMLGWIDQLSVAAAGE